jgi:diaminohydroxyphosphoribosylaminopyrimidine deaminase / 5-amino-6-(5-phosphoribosylamino)uracil reductase
LLELGNPGPKSKVQSPKSEMPSTTTLAEARTWSETDRRLMARAIELACRGVGQVSPGPLVGCVVTNSIGEVVGEGHYIYEEVMHAETIALREAGKRARGGTAYVSLEPHAHQSRTPPCTDALIAAGIKRVVVPIEDLNPQVSGRGFAHLRESGIAVEVGLMAREAAEANEKYLHLMRTRLPFVHLKCAVSLDGKVATRTGDSRWITGPEARRRVHELRHEYDAILIGSGTAEQDDPVLTDRSGLPRRRPLTRIVLDERLRLSPSSQLVRTATDAPLIVFTGEDADESRIDSLKAYGVEVVNEGTRDLKSILKTFPRRSLQSVLIEGGPTLAGSFVDAGLVNKVSFFVAPMIIGGAEAPSAIGGAGVDVVKQALRLQDIRTQQHGEDLEITGYPFSNPRR